METIVVGADDLRSAKDFAAKSVSSSIDQYARRRQTDPRTIQHQIEIGKVGEFGVWRWLNTQGIAVAPPDVSIYDARHKSYAPDLTLPDDTPLHVKSQDMESAKRFGVSWTFQYGSKVGSDKEIFAPDPLGYVAFTLVNQNRVTVYAITTVKALHEFDLFRNPKLARLRGVKTVVYHGDLMLLGDEVQWALKIPKRIEP